MILYALGDSNGAIHPYFIYFCPDFCFCSVGNVVFLYWCWF